ncbi:hypothetical protein SUGI_0235970 [Cryptomeria japonica]|uniref:zinc finger protein STAR3-like n=1 Tax=Cryptomeria japonica TaxID=3369 RepID=UPI002408935D|nr:zinc finger protein STAR3-like [Cryptomeria japonica]GLJ14576.1 hypothetical protein SUGI_0235970 [Cryptomeria japonica]
MQVPTVKRDLKAGHKYNEAQYPCSQYSSQPMLNFDNYSDKSELGRETNQAETDLFALTSKLYCLGQKAQQLEQVFRSQSLCLSGQDLQQQQAKSSLNSILSEVIYTSFSILSQCKILCNPQKPPKEEEEKKVEIIEINEDGLLAEHVHFCKICGKGFCRDGNVRIHMRSHGSQYKTQEALKSNMPKATKSHFSCPIEDCRRNRGHPNFKPLKSMVCLRNHYKRSHCAKMYSCNKCGKEFSFVTDLKTHGNKCGHYSWCCSCNTTFSTKDKLFRHVALFQEGHKPVFPSSAFAPLSGAKLSNGKILDYCAPEGLSTLAEGPRGYSGDEDLLMSDKNLDGIQQSEYTEQENAFPFFDEYGEENESYGSLFWSDADLPWP